RPESGPHGGRQHPRPGTGPAPGRRGVAGRPRLTGAYRRPGGPGPRRRRRRRVRQGPAGLRPALGQLRAAQGTPHRPPRRRPARTAPAARTRPGPGGVRPASADAGRAGQDHRGRGGQPDPAPSRRDPAHPVLPRADQDGTHMVNATTWDRVSAVGPYFEVTAGPRAHTADFRPMAELHTDAGPLGTSVGLVGRRIGTDDARVAASTLHLGTASRLWSVALASAALTGAVPDLDPEGLWWRRTPTGPLELWLPAPQLLTAGTDGDR